MDHESQVCRIVYNPHVLHLLQTKLRYLTCIVARHYRRWADDGDHQRITDCVILNNLYAEVVVRDLEEMLSTMQKERFPIELCFCHYEFYLFRFTQVFRMHAEPVAELFGAHYYKCETNAIKVLEDKDLATMCLQKMIRAYLENFYLHEASPAKSKRRVTLFFEVKKTMESEVERELLDKEGTGFHIAYDAELVATLFYIHIIEELLSLHEAETRQRHGDGIVEEFKFVERKLYKSPSESTTTTLKRSDNDDLTTMVLQKVMHSMCTTYRDQIIFCVKYHEKKCVTTATTSTTSSSLWFSGSDTSTTTTTTTKKQSSLNSEYLLEKPLNGAVTVSLSTLAMTTVTKKKNSSEFYGTIKKPMAVPIEYLTFNENTLHYQLFLYRVVFEMRLRNDHRHTSRCTTKTCYMCVYCNRNDMNTRLTQFLQLCEEPVESPEFSERIDILKQELGTIMLDLTQPIVLYGYKTLANLYVLFDYNTMLKDHPLTSLVNPAKLLDDLSSSIVLPKLEVKMADLLRQCKKKVGLRSTDDDAQLIVREQNLALDTELVRLISVAVNAQHTEIERYERSQTTLLSVESTSMAMQVAKVLAQIYTAHIDVLSQIIAERRGSVKFI